MELFLIKLYHFSIIKTMNNPFKKPPNNIFGHSDSKQLFSSEGFFKNVPEEGFKDEWQKSIEKIKRIKEGASLSDVDSQE